MIHVLRLAFKLAFFSVAFVLALIVSAWLLAFDSTPAVDRSTEFTPEQIDRAKRIIESHNPRRLRSASMRTIALSADDADVALNYLANRYAHGSTRTTFEQGHVRIQASVHGTMLPGSPYANLDVRVGEGTPLPHIESVHIGRVPLPVSLVEFVGRRLVALRLTDAEVETVVDSVRGVALQPAGVRVTYEWDATLVDAVRGALVRPEERERLRIYQQTLADATVALPPGGVSLADLLRPLFAAARARALRADAVDENRAALFVTAAYVLGQSVRDIVPEAGDWPRPRVRRVTLARRDDLAKHFILSAVLAANTGGPFADAVGLYKEVMDSRGGSGFSFNDMAADRAGSRLGQRAEDPASAHALQDRLAEMRGEQAFMPAMHDLVEGLTEAEFNERIGGLDSPRYRETMAEIERRIDALPLHR